MEGETGLTSGVLIGTEEEGDDDYSAEVISVKLTHMILSVAWS
jgi:hypothetical protein